MDDRKEQVILVDENDHAIGLMDKMAAHDGPHLHRAFSIFIFNSKGEMLLQQRALTKYHSPGLWANTCCSHPRDGETLAVATARRLKEEMGMICDMHEIFSFIYQAPVGEGLTEHEFDHVWMGVSDAEPEIDTSEVHAWKYINIIDLREDMQLHRERYTPWFVIAFEKLLQSYGLKTPGVER